MNLSRALRISLSKDFFHQSTIAFVGSGGKTTALFQLARELPPPAIITATTHLHVDQIILADSHAIVEWPEDLTGFERKLNGVRLVSGPLDRDRISGLSADQISRLREICIAHNLPMLIEADGSRQKPLKAPADHEPVIPEFVETVIVTAGLSGLGKPLTTEFVHRPDIFAHLSGIKKSAIISPEILVHVLTHPAGGLKNIPVGARRIALLNQADTPGLQALAKGMVEQLLTKFRTVIISSLNPQSIKINHISKIHAVYEPVAGVILAAGGSSRFGQPKPLLDWHGKPFVRALAETALSADLSPVVVVTGSNRQEVESAVLDLPVIMHHNQDWQSGMASSIRVGLSDFPISQAPGIHRGVNEVGAAIFLLADQPQITPAILRALSEEHSQTLAPIVAPLVGGQRANPVLFDRLTFPDLMKLNGDSGGRVIFSKYPLAYLIWHDESLLFDVDTPAEYRKLIYGE
jgi:molybdenum cofactor cytidylyltransferase